MHEDPTAIINAVLTLLLMRNHSWQLKQADCIGQNNDDKTYKVSLLTAEFEITFGNLLHCADLNIHDAPVPAGVLD